MILSGRNLGEGESGPSLDDSGVGETNGSVSLARYACDPSVGEVGTGLLEDDGF